MVLMIAVDRAKDRNTAKKSLEERSYCAFRPTRVSLVGKGIRFNVTGFVNLNESTLQVSRVIISSRVKADGTANIFSAGRLMDVAVKSEERLPRFNRLSNGR